jgi:branched-chain amino acid transport system ATP-binding protein
MLIVDQFAGRALEIGSTAYVLRRGEIVYSGSSADLLADSIFEHYIGERLS